MCGAPTVARAIVTTRTCLALAPCRTLPIGDAAGTRPDIISKGPSITRDQDTEWCPRSSGPLESDCVKVLMSHGASG